MRLTACQCRPSRLAILMFVVMVFVVILASRPAGAAVTYSTSFDFPLNSIPNGWTVRYGPEGNATTPGWKIAPEGTYQIDVNAGGVSTYIGSGDTYTDGVFTDGIVEAHFQCSNHTGVVARYQDKRFYSSRLSGNDLEIYSFGGARGATCLARISDVPYVEGETWTIRMAVLGSTITTALLNQDGTKVASLATVDHEFTNGEFGLRGGFNGVVASQWEDFSINEEVPTIDITTADGVGADSYIEYRTDQPESDLNYGGASTLAVKNAGSTPTELSRKTYLKFDLNSLGHRKYDAVLLKLNVTGSDGNGNKFNVYGLNDLNDGEQWCESGADGITWNNAPANDQDDLGNNNDGDSDSGGVIAADAVLLGQFDGQAGGTVLKFSSEALHDFIEADTDKLVTLIITRESNDPSFTGPSHSFYSKELADSEGDLSLAPTLTFVNVSPNPEPSTLLLLLAGAATASVRSVRRRRG